MAAIGYICFNGHFVANDDAASVLFWIFREEVPVEIGTPPRTPEIQD